MTCDNCERLEKENEVLKNIIKQFPTLADGSIAVPGMAVFDAGCQISDSSPLEIPYVSICIRWIDYEGHGYVDEIDDWYSTYELAKSAKLSDAEN